MDVNDIWRSMQESGLPSGLGPTFSTLTRKRPKGKKLKPNEMVVSIDKKSTTSIEMESLTVSQLKTLLEDCTGSKRNSIKRVSQYLSSLYSSLVQS